MTARSTNPRRNLCLILWMIPLIRENPLQTRTSNQHWIPCTLFKARCPTIAKTCLGGVPLKFTKTVTNFSAPKSHQITSCKASWDRVTYLVRWLAWRKTQFKLRNCSTKKKSIRREFTLFFSGSMVTNRVSSWTIIYQ